MRVPGAISRDYLTYRDELYRQEMERASKRLMHAIEDYYVARAHRLPLRMNHSEPAKVAA